MRIAFLNPQGNFDSKDSRWTTHPDFGGQLVYVKELAVSMASRGVNVDIFTRRISDPNWSEFSKRFDNYPGISKVRIIRIDFGPNFFLRKELLWPYMREFAVNIEKFYETDSGNPDFIITNYGDGGIAGAILSEKTGIPYSFTAHSLGAQKLDKMLEVSNFEELDRNYHFTTRINAERVAMKYSALNITSTVMERFEQYGHKYYQGWVNPEEKKFKVIPPGVNINIFNTKKTKVDKQLEDRFSGILEKYSDPSRHNLQMIVASSRIDPKKNHIALLKAYSESSYLQKNSNLVIAARGITDVYSEYSTLENPEREVLSELVELIDNKRLRDKVFFIDLNNQNELASFYRLAAKKNSVFALTTLYEPFGLAPIEAMACGLPAVATKFGGPSESLIEDDVEYGILVDPFDPEDIAKGLSRLIGKHSAIDHFRKIGIERVLARYTWDKTAEGYLNEIKLCVNSKYPKPKIPDYFIDGSNLPKL